MEKVNNKYINLWLSIWKINKPQYTFLKKNEHKGLEKILSSKLSFLAAIDPLPMLIAFLMAAPVRPSLKQNAYLSEHKYRRKLIKKHNINQKSVCVFLTWLLLVFHNNDLLFLSVLSGFIPFCN